jgi:integrase
MAGFHAFLVWVARDVRTDFKVPAFPWPEVDEHQPSILAPEVQGKVLLAIPWPKSGIFWCMASCLVRPSEARALRVRDWDGADEIRVARAAKDRLARGEVRGLKSRNSKVVPADEFTLRDWLAEFVPPERRLADPDGPLFANPDGHEGGWWSETAMRRTWARACDRAGVPRVSLYEGLKHSSATHLKALGADDRVLARLMGHRDPRSVERYARLDGSAIRSLVAELRRRG